MVGQVPQILVTDREKGICEIDRRNGACGGGVLARRLTDTLWTKIRLKSCGRMPPRIWAS